MVSEEDGRIATSAQPKVSHNGTRSRVTDTKRNSRYGDHLEGENSQSSRTITTAVTSTQNPVGDPPPAIPVLTQQEAKLIINGKNGPPNAILPLNFDPTEELPVHKDYDQDPNLHRLLPAYPETVPSYFNRYDPTEQPKNSTIINHCRELRGNLPKDTNNQNVSDGVWSACFNAATTMLRRHYARLRDKQGYRIEKHEMKFLLTQNKKSGLN